MPNNATKNESRGAPPTPANGAYGASGCPKANLPQPNPPNGKRERIASIANQEEGKRNIRHERIGEMKASGMRKTDSNTVRRTQGSAPTYVLLQCSNGAKKLSPKRKSEVILLKRDLLSSDMSSNTIETGAVHQIPIGA